MSGFIKTTCPKCGYTSLTPTSDDGVSKPCSNCGEEFERQTKAELPPVSEGLVKEEVPPVKEALNSQLNPVQPSKPQTKKPDFKQYVGNRNTKFAIEENEQQTISSKSALIDPQKIIFVIIVCFGVYFIFFKKGDPAKKSPDTAKVGEVESTKETQVNHEVAKVETTEKIDPKPVGSTPAEEKRDSAPKDDYKAIVIPDHELKKLRNESKGALELAEKQLSESQKERLIELEEKLSVKSEKLVADEFLENKATIILEPVKQQPRNFELAARLGDIKRIKELLSSGVNVESKNQYGYTVLMSAANNNKLEAVKLLVEAGADINLKQTSGATGFTPLMWAVMSGKADVVNYLLEKGAEIDVRDKRFGETALLISTYKYNPEATKLLLAKGAKPNTPSDKKFSPLQLAASRGFNDIVKYLLDAGADSNYYSNNETILSTGISSQDVKTVELLIKGGADVNFIAKDASYPLASAIYFGNLDIVKVLVENGADVNLENENNYTPLTAACDRGFFEIAEYLLSKEANVNAVSVKKHSALDAAVDANQINLVKLLISRGADVNVKDSNEMTPLFHAVSNNNLNMVKLLVKYGANVNVVSKYGTLASEVFTKTKGTEILHYLIKSSCDFSQKDTGGKSAIDYLAFASSKQKVLLLNEGIIKIEDCFKKHNNSYIISDELLIYCIETDNTKLFINLFEFIKEQNLLDHIATKRLKRLSFEHLSKGVYDYLDEVDNSKFVLDTREIARLETTLLLKHYKDSISTSDAKTKKATAWSLYIDSLGPDLMKNLPKFIKDLDKDRALYEVIRLEDLEALKFLVKEGANINWNNGGKNYPAVIHAMNRKDNKTLDYIFSLKPDFSLGGRNFRNALQAAGYYQNYKAFKKIRESGQDIALGFEKDFMGIKDGTPKHYEMYKYYQSLGCEFTHKATKYLAKHLILQKKNNEQELKAFLQSNLSYTVKKYILTDLVPKLFTSSFFNEKKADAVRKYFIPKDYKFPSKIDPLVRSINTYKPPLNYLYKHNLGSKSEAFKLAKAKNAPAFLYRTVKDKIDITLSQENLNRLIGHAEALGDFEMLKYIAVQHPAHVSNTSIVRAIIISKDESKYQAAKVRYPEVFNNDKIRLIYTAMWNRNFKVLDDLVVKENMGRLIQMNDLKKDEKGKYQRITVYRTLLMKAIDNKKFDVVKYFLEKGADINRVTDIQETAFTIACKNNSIELMEYLALKGANVHVRMRHMDSPWIKAIDEYKGLEKIKLFFKYGLSRSISDFQGNNPLHIAFKKDKPKIAKYLLELGISYLTPNNDGKIAQDFIKDKCKSILKDFEDNKG